MSALLVLLGAKLGPIGAALAELAGMVLAVLIAGAIFAHHYEAVGAARVQLAIDKPVTGWAARLAQCGRNSEQLEGQLNGQSAAVNANAAADKAKLAAATGDLSKAQAQTRTIEQRRGVVGQPVAIAATQPRGPSECLIPNPLAVRVLEIDRRLTQ